MKYTSIITLDNSKFSTISERPRDYVDNTLKIMRGQYQMINQSDIKLGFEKVGEVLPLKNTDENGLYIYTNGKLIELTPDSELLGLIKNNPDYNDALNVLVDIYEKIADSIIEDEDIQLDIDVSNISIPNIEDTSISLEDNIDDVLDTESDIAVLSDEVEPVPVNVAVEIIERRKEDSEDSEEGNDEKASEIIEDELPVEETNVEVEPAPKKKAGRPKKSEK